MSLKDLSHAKDRVLFVLKRAGGYVPASQISVYARCDLSVVGIHLKELQKEGKVTSKFVTVERADNCPLPEVRREYKYVETK